MQKISSPDDRNKKHKVELRDCVSNDSVSPTRGGERAGKCRFSCQQRYAISVVEGKRTMLVDCHLGILVWHLGEDEKAWSALRRLTLEDSVIMEYAVGAKSPAHGRHH